MTPILLGMFLVANAATFDVPTVSTSTNVYALERVMEVFKNIPAMIDVAACESQNRQFEGTTTEVLRGRAVREDVGVMQINERFHLETAKKMGIDIYSVDGNIAYALYLYKKNGLRDWSASFSCMSERAKLRQKTE